MNLISLSGKTHDSLVNELTSFKEEELFFFVKQHGQFCECMTLPEIQGLWDQAKLWKWHIKENVADTRFPLYSLPESGIYLDKKIKELLENESKTSRVFYVYPSHDDYIGSTFGRSHLHGAFSQIYSVIPIDISELPTEMNTPSFVDQKEKNAFLLTSFANVESSVGNIKNGSTLVSDLRDRRERATITGDTKTDEGINDVWKTLRDKYNTLIPQKKEYVQTKITKKELFFIRNEARRVNTPTHLELSTEFVAEMSLPDEEKLDNIIKRRKLLEKDPDFIIEPSYTEVLDVLLDGLEVCIPNKIFFTRDDREIIKQYRGQNFVIYTKTKFKLWFNKKGRPHRDGKPAVMNTNEYKIWFRNGKMHRDDGPAFTKITLPHSTIKTEKIAWVKNGKFYSPSVSEEQRHMNGLILPPTEYEGAHMITTIDGQQTKYWYGYTPGRKPRVYCYRFKNNQREEWFNAAGVCSRNNAPALILADGSVYYFLDGILHNSRGPAIKTPSKEIWSFDGKYHRINGPAVQLITDGVVTLEEWFINGESVKSGVMERRYTSNGILCYEKVWSNKIVEITLNTMEE